MQYPAYTHHDLSMPHAGAGDAKLLLSTAVANTLETNSAIDSHEKALVEENDDQEGTTTTKKAKHVRFSSSTKVRLVPSLMDMTNRELDRCWCNDDDSARMEQDLMRSVKYMRRMAKEGGNANNKLNEQNQEQSGVSSRGLEHFRSPEHLQRRKAHKQDVTNAVLDEQERQRLVSGGVHDHEKIALASTEFSTLARNLALAMAAADEAYVLRIRQSSERRAVTRLQQYQYV